MKRVIDGIISIAELLDNVPAPMMVEQSEQSDIDSIVRKLTGAAPSTPAAAPGAVVHTRGLARSATPTHGHALVPAAPVVVQAVSRTVTFEPRKRHEIAPGAPRILLAHEGLPERRALRDALEAAGYAVIEAADGEAALRYARRLRPSLFITDLALPKIDGFGLLQALRSELGIPMLVFTAQTDLELRMWAHECGCQDVITEDRGSAALVESVKAALPAAATLGASVGRAKRRHTPMPIPIPVPPSLQRA